MEEIQEEASPQESVTQVDESQTSGVEEVVEAKEESKEEVLPFGKHPRWQKMVTENRQYKTQLKDLETKLKENGQYEDARKLHEALNSDPQKFKKVMDILYAKEAPAEDPYSDFDPKVAEKFRKIDAFEKWQAEQEKKEQQLRQDDVGKNMDALDNSFDRILTEKGFINKDGSRDDKEVAMLQKATIAILAETGDPRTASEKQLQSAIQTVLDGLSAYEKRVLRNTTRPAAPPSGSNKGSIPQGKKSMSEEDRINDLANSFFS